MHKNSSEKSSAKEGIKIPQQEVVKFIIKESLRKRKALSQKDLAATINRELVKGESGYRISGKRARLLALQIPVKITIETRHGPQPEKCPVCNKSLKKRYSKNLAGKKLLSALDCSRCGYHGTIAGFVPSRYYFSL